jgi:hypothetical protein
MIFRFLNDKQKLSAPWFIELLNAAPLLRRLPALALAAGFKSEHVKINRVN